MAGMCSPNGWDNTQSGVIRDELVEGIHPDAVPGGRRVTDPFRPKPGDDRTAMSQRAGDPGGPDGSGSSQRSSAVSIGVASQQAYAGRSPVLDAAQLEVLRSYGNEVIGAVGAPARSPDGYLGVFFTHSDASRQAGVETLGRLSARRDDRDTQTTSQTRQAQYDAVCEWGIPNHGQLQRVSAIGVPVFVANGDGDPMILPHFSHLLAGLIPQAQVKIYPDAAHGFLFQHHAEFARDVNAFLRE